MTCLFVGCNKPDDDDKEEPAQKTVTSVELTKSEASVLLGEVLSLSATVKYSECGTDSNADLGYSVKAENKDITKANIPDSYNGVRVTQIEEDAFRQCVKLEEFSFGKSVVRIGAHAFTMEKEYELQVNGSSEVLIEHDRKAEVSARLRVDLDLNPGTVLEEYSLADSFFKVITLPEGLTEIPAYAFTGSTVTEVIFPTTLTSIKGYAFAGCANLTAADMTHTKVTEIGSAGSDECGIGNAFLQCGVLKKAGVMPSTLKTIEPYSFSVCTNLQEITLNNGLEKIGAQAFMQCASVASLDIPVSVTVVGANAFGRWGSDQTIGVAFAQGNEPAGWSSSWAGDNCRAVISYK